MADWDNLGGAWVNKTKKGDNVVNLEFEEEAPWPFCLIDSLRVFDNRKSKQKVTYPDFKVQVKMRPKAERQQDPTPFDENHDDDIGF